MACIVVAQPRISFLVTFLCFLTCCFALESSGQNVFLRFLSLHVVNLRFKITEDVVNNLFADFKLHGLIFCFSWHQNSSFAGQCHFHPYKSNLSLFRNAISFVSNLVDFERILQKSRDPRRSNCRQIVPQASLLVHA